MNNFNSVHKITRKSNKKSSSKPRSAILPYTFSFNFLSKILFNYFYQGENALHLHTNA